MSNNICTEVDIKSTMERPRQGVSVQIISEMHRTEILETQASFHGEIHISGERRQDFLNALCKLVDEFRI